MDKDEIAEMFEEIAVLLELKGENPFKTRAYTNAARTISGLDEPIKKLIEEDRLKGIKGIGSALQEKIHEAVTTGKLEYFDKLKASIPAGLVALLDIPGMGPKKVKAVHGKLGVESIEQLEAACKEDKVASLSGFGAKTQTRILEGIEFRRKFASKHHLDDALRAADPILEALRDHPDTIRCSQAGSLRRWKEVIGDLDFLVSSKKPAEIIGYFSELEGVQNILAKGDTKASVVLEDGIQADLRVVTDEEFPFALAYFTGSKEHNIVMRQRAIQRGLRLNEYGLFKSKEETRDPGLRIGCKTEEEIFDELGLDFIPPELREDHGEFDASENGQLPRLLEWSQLRGSLHNHTNWSDGRATIDETADFMRELGCAYWAITDHSKSSFQANGLDEKRLRKQIAAIADVNKRMEDEGSDFRLLTGSEVDILTKGDLDFCDDLLADLEVVVASVHNAFTQPEAEMTKRIIRAVENPHVHMLGHLTGRLLLERNAYAVDQRAVIEACAETDTWIELNASPYRFDLDWRLWKYAKEKGVKCVINCDAHRNDHAGFLRLGAGIARKGWLTANDVINTRSYAELKKLLETK